MPELKQCLQLILDELDRAKKKWPGWPTDPVHAAAIVAEEAGELVQAALQTTYETTFEHLDRCREEAIQTAAMAIRFLEALEQYQLRRLGSGERWRNEKIY